VCQWVSNKKNIGRCNNFFASLKSLKKLVESISQRYGSGDPDPHKNVTDPRHCLIGISGLYLNVLVDDVLAGEAVLFLHIFRVTEYTVAGVEVVVCPPRREIKISHYVGLNIIEYNLPFCPQLVRLRPHLERYPAADMRSLKKPAIKQLLQQLTHLAADKLTVSNTLLSRSC
jgi:hypothetical protein